MSTMTVRTFHALSAPAQTEIILQHGEALKYEIHLSIYQRLKSMKPSENRKTNVPVPVKKNHHEIQSRT